MLIKSWKKQRRHHAYISLSNHSNPGLTIRVFFFHTKPHAFMKSSNKLNKVMVALTGPTSSPKLFSALQIGFGLTGSYKKILVISTSYKAFQYQHMGDYSVLTLPRDSTPNKYLELLALVAACGKEVVIISNLSDEWTEGVSNHLQSSFYEEVLRSHRELFNQLRQLPFHVVGCIDSTKKISFKDDNNGRHRLMVGQKLIQQPKIERYFNTVLRVDKRGCALAVKDTTMMMPSEKTIKVTPQIGAALSDFCKEGRSVIPKGLQEMIDSCQSLGDLYELLFDLDVDDVNLLTAFTKRRLELETSDDRKMIAQTIGGLHEH
jgi:hypothetical protein